MRRGIMTAYRQKALAIAEYLQEHGETKAAVIAQSLANQRPEQFYITMSTAGSIA
ncbi:MAG: hypothetical protein CM1200mP18_18720 [Gammaproteobacteria bacterium]|nr:MAG: hypothetical protein CM1200mP18_18720 [Gammaproteobacteria bacterium]